MGRCEGGEKERNAICQKTRSASGCFGKLIDLPIAGNAKSDEISMTEIGKNRERGYEGTRILGIRVGSGLLGRIGERGDEVSTSQNRDVGAPGGGLSNGTAPGL